MKNIKLNLSPLILIFSLFITNNSIAQTVLLYKNTFESPNLLPQSSCSPDLDTLSVNILWGGTALGTGGGGDFKQQHTVETILIRGQNLQYSDPSGLGGNYCLGMLTNSLGNNDKLALTLNSQMLDFLNISFLMSPIDLPGCSGPFGVDTAKMQLTVYDTPGGIFSFASPGNIVDQQTISGGAPGLSSYTFNWYTCMASLNISNSTDSNITIVFDLIQSGYAAIDSIQISSSVKNSIQEDFLSGGFTIFPNPTNGELYISKKDFVAAKTILTISDIFGRRISQFDIQSQSTFLELESPPGIYIATISTATNNYSTKIILE